MFSLSSTGTPSGIVFIVRDVVRYFAKVEGRALPSVSKSDLCCLLLKSLVAILSDLKCTEFSHLIPLKQVSLNSQTAQPGLTWVFFTRPEDNFFDPTGEKFL